MTLKWSWAAFAADILRLAPQALADVAQDKATFSDEQHTRAAAQAAMQASQLAKLVDPGDQDTIDEATAVAGTVIAAVKLSPPVGG